MGTFKIFLAICFFRNRVDDVRISTAGFPNALMIYVSVSTVLKGLIMDPGQAVIQSLCEITFMAVFLLVLLNIVGKQRRFVQTMITLLNCESIVGACAVPVAIWMNLISQQSLWIPFYSLFIFVAWGIAVIGFILKQILAKKKGFSLRLACVYFFQIHVVSSLLLVI